MSEVGPSHFGEGVQVGGATAVVGGVSEFGGGVVGWLWFTRRRPTKYLEKNDIKFSWF